MTLLSRSSDIVTPLARDRQHRSDTAAEAAYLPLRSPRARHRLRPDGYEAAQRDTAPRAGRLSAASRRVSRRRVDLQGLQLREHDRSTAYPLSGTSAGSSDRCQCVSRLIARPFSMLTLRYDA